MHPAPPFIHKNCIVQFQAIIFSVRLNLPPSLQLRDASLGSSSLEAAELEEVQGRDWLARGVEGTHFCSRWKML